jgi:hypothetical protein
MSLRPHPFILSLAGLVTHPDSRMRSMTPPLGYVSGAGDEVADLIVVAYGFYDLCPAVCPEIRWKGVNPGY